MTQEEKQLLLKDLCARLPYGVKFQSSLNNKSSFKITAGEWWEGERERITYILSHIQEFKYYLHPMSSMTEEEYNIIDWEGCRHIVYYDKNGFRFIKIDSFTIPVFDYLNARHFDFRYLIEKGLALEAPKDMYETK